MSPEFQEQDYLAPMPARQFEGTVDTPSKLRVRFGDLLVEQAMVPGEQSHIDRGASSSFEVIKRGMPVSTQEGVIGKLSLVVVDQESLKGKYLVVDPGHFPQSRIVPISMVERVSKDGIRIDAEEGELAELPVYIPRSDVDILADLRLRLKEASLDLMTVKIGLRNGVIHLTGVVRDVEVKNWVGSVARAVEGVIDVENALHTDSNVIARIRGELGSDHRTETSHIQVESHQGVVRLGGEVESQEVRMAAEEIAARQPGVFTVVNAMTVESRGLDDPGGR